MDCVVELDDCYKVGGGELDKIWREKEVIGGQGNKGER